MTDQNGKKKLKESGFKTNYRKMIGQSKLRVNNKRIRLKCMSRRINMFRWHLSFGHLEIIMIMKT